ncbi:MauE/DoxX family redox-associated membrane protein [Asinibacterium sp. OR53]|uniref:MauE/DoxX family redox-associated membrane protein n=1 Tax=Asinibacterium sp. OR53 TaxID=925409 RepID=UPI0006873C89|nr:MauE/DoxX family redox-associated membrane protein [Asinibacterium sp. OR53]
MKRLFYQLIVLLLVALYSYTATSKWADFIKFRNEMMNQPIAHWVAESLIYTLPVVELAIALGLLAEKFRKMALLLSSVLLLSFTLYAYAVIIGGFSRIPCSCGGFIGEMTWLQHLFFTLILSIASFWSFCSSNQKLYMYNRSS